MGMRRIPLDTPGWGVVAAGKEARAERSPSPGAEAEVQQPSFSRGAPGALRGASPPSPAPGRLELGIFNVWGPLSRREETEGRVQVRLPCVLPFPKPSGVTCASLGSSHW